MKILKMENIDGDLENQGGIRKLNYQSDDDDNNDDSVYVVQIAKNLSFNHFVDTITPYADDLLKLPYGIIALLIEGIDLNLNKQKRTKDDIEKLKTFYLMIGVLLTKKDKILIFTLKDVEILENITNDIAIHIALQELILTNSITAKYNDGEWLYSLTKEQNEKVEEFLENLANRKP